MSPSFSIVPRATEVRRLITLYFSQRINTIVAAVDVFEQLLKDMVSQDAVLDPPISLDEVKSALDDLWHDYELFSHYRNGVKQYYLTPPQFKGLSK